MCRPKSEEGLDFRNLHDFNVALLGKQRWRLLTQPDSLVSKVYKARYFPHCSFISAKLGGNPSYVWRSILEAQNLIINGISCRLGSGESISILNDPWLPDVNNPFITTSNMALEGRKVSSLMVTGENRWDVELILIYLTRGMFI